MLDLLKARWYYALAAASLAALLLWLLVRALSGPAPAAPPLTAKQERRTEAASRQAEAAAYADTLAAAKADTTSRRAYASGAQLARMARAYHHLTLLAHAPHPVAPTATAVDSLQRLLSTY